MRAAIAAACIVGLAATALVIAIVGPWVYVAAVAWSALAVRQLWLHAARPIPTGGG